MIAKLLGGIGNYPRRYFLYRWLDIALDIAYKATLLLIGIVGILFLLVIAIVGPLCIWGLIFAGTSFDIAGTSSQTKSFAIVGVLVGYAAIWFLLPSNRKG